MKRMILLFLMVFYLLIPISCEKPFFKAGEPDYEADRGKKYIEITGWGNYPLDLLKLSGNKAYNDVLNAGFTIAPIGYNPILNGTTEYITTSLNEAEAVGIKQFVNDEVLRTYLRDGDKNRAQERINMYLNHPAFLGNHIVDEPSAVKFDELAAMHQLYKEIAPGKMFYVNLLPCIANSNQKGNVSYDEYIQLFIDKVKPSFISYDNYVLLYSGSSTSVGEEFLYNLELIASKAKAAAIPLWVFVQATGFNNYNRPPESVRDIRFQDLTYMAYGVSALQYFCYYSPRAFSGMEIFDEAMISNGLDVNSTGQAGDTTVIYEYVRTVNMEIKQFEHVYKNFEWYGTMPVKGKNPTIGTAAFERLTTPLTKVDGIKSVESTQDCIIGAFKDVNNYYGYMIVNYTDPAKNIDNSVSVVFDGAKKAVVYNKGVKSIIDIQNNAYTFEIESGDGVFVIPYR